MMTGEGVVSFQNGPFREGLFAEPVRVGAAVGEGTAVAQGQKVRDTALNSLESGRPFVLLVGRQGVQKPQRVGMEGFSKIS